MKHAMRTAVSRRRLLQGAAAGLFGAAGAAVLAACGETQVVTKEVIKEVQVETVVTKEVIKEVPVERVVTQEVIKEVVKEVVVTAAAEPMTEEMTGPVSGGTITVGAGTPSTRFWNPYAQWGSEHHFINDYVWLQLWYGDQWGDDRLPSLPGGWGQGAAHKWDEIEPSRVYDFHIHPDLVWHDGAPVTAADCVASIHRWGARDGMGQKLMDVTAALEAVDDATFRLTLTQPYGLVLESLSKASSNVLFIMPERHALTDPFEQVPEVIGSGPFVFVADEWVPGARVVYVRNEAYVPRSEPPSWGAGGKVAKVDRVEWLYVPDTATAMNALLAGEIDYFELPPHDLLPIMEASPDVTVKRLDPVGVQGHIRLNHLYPPFDHPKAREAMLWLVEQPRLLRAVVGNEEHWRSCPAYFGCGSPYETDAGAAALMTFDPERAQSLLEEAGYDGRPVVLMQPTDVAILSGAALMLAGVLRDAGVNVELQAMDWSTLTSRRALDARRCYLKPDFLPPGRPYWRAREAGEL